MDERGNFLAKYAWGELPVSRRRQKRANWAHLSPSVTLFFVWCAMAIFTLSKAGHKTEAIIYSNFLIAAWIYFGVVIGMLLPFMLENRWGNALILRRNYTDYRMAGLSGSEILKGLAAPQMSGMWLLFWSHCIPSAVIMIVISGAISAIAGEPTGLWAYLAFIPAVIFNLVAGTYYHLSLWPVYSSKTSRTLLLTSFMLFSPATIFMVFSPLCLWGGGDTAIIFVFNHILALLIVETLLLLGRYFVVRSAWTAACNRLDGNDL